MEEQIHPRVHVTRDIHVHQREREEDTRDTTEHEHYGDQLEGKPLEHSPHAEAPNRQQQQVDDCERQLLEDRRVVAARQLASRRLHLAGAGVLDVAVGPTEPNDDIVLPLRSRFEVGGDHGGVPSL